MPPANRGCRGCACRAYSSCLIIRGCTSTQYVLSGLGFYVDPFWAYSAWTLHNPYITDRIDVFPPSVDRIWLWVYVVLKPPDTAYSKGTLLGTPNKEPQENDRNVVGIYLPGSLYSTIFLPYSWGSLFGVTMRTLLYSIYFSGTLNPKP